MRSQLDINNTIFDITEKHPETVDFFVANGFPQFSDNQMRSLLGKAVTLREALLSKRINHEVFLQKLDDIITQNSIAIELGLTEAKRENGGAIRIEGVLPCPIRIPFLEKFSRWLEENENKLGFTADFDLRPASMGVSWIKERIIANKENAEEKLTDIFMSAGFELFFENNLIKKYKDRGIFENITGVAKLNTDFDNQHIDLKDPDNHYAVIGVVPAIFIVNKTLLSNRPLPATWEDLLRPEFADCVSLPLEDLDMFDAILLNIYKKYGADGVAKLGKAMLKSMHPAAMLKSYLAGDAKSVPVVSVLPYFFAKTMPPGSPFVTVWPKDGAIISPIYLITKKSSQHLTKPFVDFLFSKEIGDVFSVQGFFPSTHPQVDNGFGEGQNFMWLGWDYIKENDIGRLIAQTKHIFYKEMEEKK